MSKIELILPRGPVPYATAHQLQKELVGRVQHGGEEALILLEHPPTITLGRNADTTGILADQASLAARGIAVHHIERGGQATCHGPGQMVGYPILNLRKRKIAIRQYVEMLEEVMILTCAEYGLEVRRWEENPGVYCRRGKIGALGVRVSAGVAFHGFALNNHIDLGIFDLIIPCGLKGTPVTSLAACLTPAPEMNHLRSVTARVFAMIFDLEFK